MKKTALFLLSLVLLLTAASCGKSAGDETPETLPVETTSEEAETETPEPEETAEPVQLEFPDGSQYTTLTDLELAKPAEYRDGILILYFKQTDIWYKPDTICSVGLISDDSAESFPATLDMTSFPDMFDGDDYCGAALVPSSPLPSGSYIFSVSIAEYLVSFNVTID